MPVHTLQVIPRAYSGLRSSLSPAQIRYSCIALSAGAIREGLYDHEDNLTIRVCFVLFDAIQVGQVPTLASGWRICDGMGQGDVVFIGSWPALHVSLYVHVLMPVDYNSLVSFRG